MDEKVIDELLDAILPMLASAESQSTAALQAVKQSGALTEEQLAPLIEQASNATEIKMRATRLRLKRVLTAAVSDFENDHKKKNEEEQKSAESAEKKAESDDKESDHQKTEGPPKESAEPKKKASEPKPRAAGDQEKQTKPQPAAESAAPTDQAPTDKENNKNKEVETKTQ